MLRGYGGLWVGGVAVTDSANIAYPGPDATDADLESFVSDLLDSLYGDSDGICGFALAHTFDEAASSPAWVEPKIDGWRFRLIFDGGYARVQARSGADYSHELGFIAAQMLDSVVAECGTGTVFIDGEVYAGSWNRTASLCSRDYDGSRRGLKFYAFDLVDGSAAPLSERKAKLRRIFGAAQPRNVSIVPHRVARNAAEIDAAYRWFLGRGFEGAMVKDPAAEYEPKRSRSWQKIKPWQSAEGVLVSVEEGAGKHAGTLGSMTLRVGGNHVHIGAGWDDADRDSIWARRDSLGGEEVEFRYQVSDAARFRHATFLRIREDRL